MKITLGPRIYFFACNFLWGSLSLFHYLDEEVAEENIGQLYLSRWSRPFANLANWALEERFSPIRNEKVPRDEDDLLFSTVGTCLDTLILYWSNALNTGATEMHDKYRDVNKSMWLYYFYCRFLDKILIEFERVLQEPNSSPVYYKHYRQDISLFNDMAKALENERPFLESSDFNEATVQTVWEHIDAYTSKMGEEWRQAVLAVARDLKLPDSFESTA